MIRQQNTQACYFASLGLILTVLLPLTACKKEEGGDSTPPPAKVVSIADMNLISVDADKVHQFPLVAAEKVETASQITATGSVTPDIARQVPVISLANGRVVDIRARLGDKVKKGQLLLKVQSTDASTAFDAYLKAVNDEQLARKAFARAKDLLEHGAISQALFEQAEDAENNAKADLTAAEEQLKTLGVDKDHPSPVVNVYAPISGVITAQNVTQSAAAGVSLAGSPTAFTISDLSHVWILCDVFENDLARVKIGETAIIHITAYPDQALKGRIGDIGAVLDPTLRTAKIRIEVPNPGILKVGMFVTATFANKQAANHTAIPATAILHLHDRDWVFVPAGGDQFKRTEVQSGAMLPGGKQEILSGLDEGQQVVLNALSLEGTVSQ